MPELPEVETICQGLRPHVKQRTIIKVVVRNSRLRWPIVNKLPALLKNQHITTIDRRAKYLLFNLDSGTLIVHLGMSGTLHLVDSNKPIIKHDHVDIVLNNNQIIRYNDPRRFGAILWTEQAIAEHPLLSKLGPEPLTHKFTGKILFNAAQKRRIPVKAFIMDNKVVVGVGNIYATEALFKVGIHPAKAANTIDLDKYLALAKEIKITLKKAIAKGGTTLKDFSNINGAPGYFAQTLQVYGRAQQPCLNCKTLLSSVIIAQRTSVFCSNCQT